MPNRILRDGILSSEGVCSLSWSAEVFYRRLMSVADDHGRFHGIPTLIRSACYPLQIDKVSDSDIEKWLTACVTAALVRVYPASDGKRYVQIVKFGQQVRSKSKFPDPIEGECEHLKSSASNCEQVIANAHLDVGVFEGVDEGVLSNPKGLEVGIPSDQPAEPDGKETEAKRRKNCPVTRIVALYHECLPNNPAVEKVTDARAGYIRQRWLDDLPTLDAWKNYFEYVGKSAFLTGRTQGRDGKAPFVADIEFLTKPASFTKTAEGKYHR